MCGCVLDDRVSDANIVVRIECHSSMNRRGERTSDELCISVAASDVRPRLLSSETPVLSLLLVRWGGADGVDDEEDHCGAISSSVSDGYIESFLSVVYETLGPRYECVSVFVESSADLSAMEQAQLASMLHGSQRAALYFLWPSRFREGAVTRRNVDGVPLRVGVVNAAASLHAMEAMEAAGVPTRFPHASQLYAALLSKEYQASLCTSAEFALPATTLVNRGAAVRDPSRAAASAVSALAKLRTEGTPPPGMGVVKLGFSWEAVHVRTFTSTAELAAVLEALACKDGCEAPCLLVQDWVPNAFEMRVYLVRGRPAHVAYSDFGWEGCGFMGKPYDFEQKARAAVISDWLDDDEAAMAHAEEQARHLAVHVWARWLRAISSEPIPALRVDFLVGHAAPGRATVRSLELTELGFCMLGWKEGPRLVMGALLETLE